MIMIVRDRDHTVIFPFFQNFPPKALTLDGDEMVTVMEPKTVG
jgi:hypothetical protein